MSILIIGSGFVGSGLASHMLPSEHKLMRHNDQWAQIIELERPELVVNAAAITGQSNCHATSWDNVKRSNIDLPAQIAQTALEYGSQCLLLSTGAVYARPISTPKPEHAKLSRQMNLYVQSKILMEQKVSKMDVVIFRIPSVYDAGYHKWDYLNRIRESTWVQDCYTSLLGMRTLFNAVKNIKQHVGIYNIADEGIVHLPSYVKSKYKELPILEDSQMPPRHGLTHLLDITKAKEAGIL